jgi:hypothetical protein
MVAFGSWTLLYALLGSIAVLHVEAAGSQNISNDAFFYGLSPAVYPTRKLCLLAPPLLQLALGAALIPDRLQLERGSLLPSLEDSASMLNIVSERYWNR